MATTTNFGWETPDDTDLVKDGALAMRTLGNAIDASLVDLKGGTTGQVLSKTSDTDMDFTWVTSDDANAIQNAIVDAKGDLIAASAADTPARLAVGNNGESLVADSSASTGLRWQSPKTVNNILNSDFSIWQRGTSTTSGSVYAADRWYKGASSGTTVTMSRQLTGDTTNLPFIQYCARVQRNSGQTGTSAIDIGQPFETAASIPLAGKTVVLSFYARRGSNFSSSSNLLNVRIFTGTGTDQNVFSTYTGLATPLDTNFTLTTTWQRFSASVTLGSTITELTPYFRYDPTGTAGANDFFEITGVQLEVGSVATPFTTATGTLAGELAACQRYAIPLFRASGIDCAIVVSRNSTTAGECYIQLPVQMRTLPSASLISGNFGRCVFYDTSFGLTTSNVSAISIGDGGNYAALNVLLTHGSVSGSYVTASWDTAANGGFILLSAEL